VSRLVVTRRILLVQHICNLYIYIHIMNVAFNTFSNWGVWEVWRRHDEVHFLLNAPFCYLEELRFYNFPNSNTTYGRSKYFFLRFIRAIKNLNTIWVTLSFRCFSLCIIHPAFPSLLPHFCISHTYIYIYIHTFIIFNRNSLLFSWPCIEIINLSTLRNALKTKTHFSRKSLGVFCCCCCFIITLKKKKNYYWKYKNFNLT